MPILMHSNVEYKECSPTSHQINQMKELDLTMGEIIY